MVFTIPKNHGDLLGKIYVKITLPEITPSNGDVIKWCEYIGERLIKSVELRIGGHIIDKQDGRWMHTWNQLSLTNEQKKTVVR